MEIKEFNEIYMSRVLEKLTLEKKHLLIAGDFNIDLLHANDNTDTNDFFEMTMSNSLIPLILRPTRITCHSKTVIDKIFGNFLDTPLTTGNFTRAISDHLAQFAVINPSTGNTKKVITKTIRDFKKFKKEDFFTEISNVDWDEIINIEKNNPNYSLDQFIKENVRISNKHAPEKKVTIKHERKQKLKPWITTGIVNSIN